MVGKEMGKCIAALAGYELDVFEFFFSRSYSVPGANGSTISKGKVSQTHESGDELTNPLVAEKRQIEQTFYVVVVILE